MIKTILKAVVGRFERRYDYDASYMRTLVDIDPRAFFAFSKVQGFSSYRRGPSEALAAAGIASTLAEDCGPCTQIVVRMAEEGGISPAILKAVLEGDETAMGPEAALGWRFARACLARDMEAADPLRDEIVRRWGDKALASIALGLATGRIYPTVKYALGYGKACSKVRVGGEAVAPARAA